MKHWLPTLSTLAGLALIVAACGAAIRDDSGCTHKIGYITGGGKLNDQSLNQAGWDGVVAGAQAIGLDEACYSFVETADGADYSANIETFVGEGFDVIVTAGVNLDEVTREAGRVNPAVTFIGINQHQPQRLSNVTGLVFREDEEGFLAGALAGLTTESGVVGGVFGCKVLPSSIRFATGYRNGARHVNPAVDVQFAYHPGAIDVCGFDSEFGMDEAMMLVIEQGADVIFGAAGGQTGDGALLAACSVDVKSIGVDFDRYASLPQARSCLLSSVVRDYVGGVRDLIIATHDGTIPDGDVYGSVALAPFHEVGRVIAPETKEQLEDVARRLSSGELDACMLPLNGADCISVP